MRIATVTASFSLLLLAGCATVTGTTRPDPPAGEIPEVHCIVGVWQLDTDDFAAQSEAYLVGLGMPINSLAMSGHQTITINDGPTELYFGITTDLTTDAVVQGVAVSARSTWAGDSPFVFADGANDAIELTGWSYIIEPGAPAAEAPPPASFVDPTSTEPVQVVCSGDTLSVHGAGAPLVGLFVRVD